MTTTKQCFKCLKTTPITNFYKHKQMDDGHLGKCKQCAIKDSKMNRDKNIDKIRAYDRHRGVRSTKEYKRITNGNRYISAKEECCHCGIKDNIQKHHPDYNDPTYIVPLCIKCHNITHTIIRLKREDILALAAF